MNSKKLILSGIIPIFILGSITHFAYDWCSITLLGLVAPINSSIWEHMKMGLLPTIIWWGLTYLLFKDKLKLDFKRYFVAFTVSLLVSTFLMPFLYLLSIAYNFIYFNLIAISPFNTSTII